MGDPMNNPIDELMYIVFPTHTDGLAMEKRLKAADIEYQIVPTPRQFSQSCGISVQISEADLNEVQSILAYSSNIKTRGIHKVEKKKFKLFGKRS